MERLLPLAVLAILLPGQDKKSQDGEARFQVTFFAASLGEGPLVILERPGNMHYEAPYLTANATVRCTTPDRESHVIGFVQQLDSNTNRNDYDQAFTTWEHPRLPISDTGAGEKAPWYRQGSGTCSVDAGAKDFEAVVAHDDNLSSNITWKEPLPPRGNQLAAKPTLNRVQREQSFTVWLIARRESDHRIVVLKKLTWKIELEISVDCAQPVGARCKVVKLKTPKPVISDPSGEALPEAVLSGPSANEAQEFWWNPKGEGKRIRLNR